MATLTSKKIKNTYDALLKSIDNDAIGTTAKQITDGLGNVTPLYVSTTQVGIGVTPESGLNLHVYGDAKIGSNLTIIGNLVVEGSTTTVGTDTLTVKDPLIVLANNNTSTDAVDIGFYGKYTPSGTTLYSGLFREALTGKYRLFKDLQDEPTTTVNTGGTGYAQATLIAALEGDVTGNITGNVTGNLTGNVTGNVTGDLTGDVTGDVTGDLTGNVTGGSITATTGLFTDNVNIAGTLVIDDELTVEGSAFGRIEIGGPSGGYIDLKAPHSDDYDLRLITSTGGGELLSIDTLKFYTGATTDLAFSIDASQNATFENNVTIPETPTADTHAASKGYVDAAVEGQDTLAEILANGNTSGANDIIMADNQKIYYGTGSDVEMYFDGATQFGIINDTAGGSIFLRSDSFLFRNDTDQFYSLSSTTHTFKSSGTTRLTVNSTGIDVNGNINLGDNNKILLGVGDDLEIYHDGSHSYINDSGTGDLIFTSGVNERMRIQSGGDISINESNPLNSAKFYVNGVGYSTNAWSVGNSSGTIRGRLTTSGSILQIQSEENNDIQIGDTTSANIIHIDTSEDSVGIGLTNPADYTADELVISVPDGSGMTLVSGTTDAAYITFMSSTGAIATNGGYIGYDHNADTLTNFAQSKVSVAILEAEVAYFTDTAFYVDKSTTIDDNLTVNGNSTFAGQVIASSSSSGDYVRMYGGSGTAQWDIYGNGENLRISENSGGGGHVDIDTNLIVDGNVGIGVSNPSDYYSTADDLVVGGSSNHGITIATGDANTGAIHFADGTSGTAEYAGYIAYQHNDDKMRFGVNASDKLVIDSSGNVGINETSLTEKLEVDGAIVWKGALTTSKTSAGVLDRSGNDLRIRAYGATAGSGNLVFRTGGGGGSVDSERMRIGSSGNVSIGQDEGGSAFNANSVLQLSPISSGNPVYIGLKSDVSNNCGILMGDTGDSYVGGFIYNNPNNYLVVNTNNAERMRIDSSGNVGIGTTSPTEKLDVEGNIQAIKTGGGSVAYIDVVSGATWRFASNPISGTNAYGLNIIKGSAGTDVKMSIDTNGNVGIGTDSPDKLLELSGASGTAVLRLTNTDGTVSSGESLGSIEWQSNDGSTPGGTGTQGIINVVDDNSYGNAYSMTFSTANGGTLSERMRITSAGDMIIKDYGNIYASTNNSTVNSGIYFGGSDNTLRSYTNDTERMRIDSSGHIYQGTVGEAANKYYYFQNSTTADAGLVFKDNASTNSGYLTYNHGLDAMKFGVNGSERMQIESDGTVRVKTGSVLVETAGQGIYLGGTAVANKLDDYEEGTWTPTNLGTIGLSTAPSSLSGRYTKIGRQVIVSFALAGYSCGTGIKAIVIGGFPFIQHSAAHTETGYCSTYPHSDRRSGIVIDNSGGDSNNWFVGFKIDTAASNRTIRGTVMYTTT